MAANAPFGFSPLRKLTGEAYSGKYNTYAISSSDLSSYWVGDLVKSAGGAFDGKSPNGGQLLGIPYVEKAAAGDTVRGVIVAILPSFGDLNINNVPATKGHVYLVGVCDDPEMIFSVQANNTAGFDLDYISGSADYLPTNASASSSVSATVLDYSDKSTSVGKTLQILGLAKTSVGAYATVAVRLYAHELGGGSSSAPPGGSDIDDSLTAAEIAAAILAGTLTPGIFYRASDDDSLLYYASAADEAGEVATVTNLPVILAALGYSTGYSGADTRKLAGIDDDNSAYILAQPIIYGRDLIFTGNIWNPLIYVQWATSGGTYTPDSNAGKLRITHSTGHAITTGGTVFVSSAGTPSINGLYTPTVTSATVLNAFTPIAGGATLDYVADAVIDNVAGATILLYSQLIPANFPGKNGNVRLEFEGGARPSSANNKTLNITIGGTVTNNKISGSTAISTGSWTTTSLSISISRKVMNMNATNIQRATHMNAGGASLVAGTVDTTAAWWLGLTASCATAGEGWDVLELLTRAVRKAV